METTADTEPAAPLSSVTLERGDVAAARRFRTAFGGDTHIQLRAREAQDSGFRGSTLAPAVSGPATVKPAPYKRGSLAKDLGVPDGAAGSHRIVLGSTAGAFTGPDGFAWEPTSSAGRA
ncbi:hypothetical protein [Streptomyces sp. SID9727]|uniref:hypothetical protein n=1 Tax=Streptomyces sp. SID9727 TaxID=2706114 RepID=UPI0019404C67|nr:hypothetical protein [Streptomyces sp. SID9727]